MKNLINYINEWHLSDDANITVDNGQCKLHENPNVDYLLISTSGEVIAFSEYGLKKAYNEMEKRIKNGDPDPDDYLSTLEDLMSITEYNEFDTLTGPCWDDNDSTIFRYGGLFGIKFKHKK